MATLAIGIAIGVGGYFLQQAFMPKPKPIEGPRLSDINVPAVSPGNPIVRHWGTMKLPGQLIWTSKLIETKHVEKVGGGGKGGGGSRKQKQITYTYSVYCAIAVCKGPVYRIRRIWANQKLLWQNPEIAGEAQQDFLTAYYEEGQRLLDAGVDVDEAHVSAFIFAFNNYELGEYTLETPQQAINWVISHPIGNTQPSYAGVSEVVSRMFSGLDKEKEYLSYKSRFDRLRIYLGTEDQTPDPTIESYKGVGNVPAFRGTCYFVIDNLQLEDFGNSIPAFNVEVEKTPGDVQLREILADICRESGMDESEFSTAEIGDAFVPGFAVTQATSARNVIQDLQMIYPFDGAETAYRLRFSWLDKRAVAILRPEDFGAHEQGDEPPPSETIVRVQEFDLPQKLTLSYQEPGRNYSMNTMTAQRMVTASNMVREIDVTIALTRSEAKSRVEEALSNIWKARREYTYFLPRKYIIMEPGDFVLIPEVKGTRMFRGARITEVNTGANGIIEMKMIDHHPVDFIAANASTDLIVDDDETDAPPIASITVPYLLDLPLLMDTEEDNVGFYVVLGGTRTGWNGGYLVLDMADGGVVPVFGTTPTQDSSGAEWITVAYNDEDVPHGFTLNKLGYGHPGVWDRANRLRVRLRNAHAVIQSRTEQELLQMPVNVAVVGDEIIQFAGAIDLGNGLWELHTLLRGLRGTEWAIDLHDKADRFVMLTMNGTDRVTHDASLLNVEGRFRAISVGEDLDSATDLQFTNTGNSKRPYSPFIKSALRRDDGSIELEWLPRVRQNGLLLNGQGTPFDQPTEEYEVEVLNGNTVVRTEHLNETRQWTYSAANHLSDFGAIQDKVQLRLYQIGSIVGRGFAAEVWV